MKKKRFKKGICFSSVLLMAFWVAFPFAWKGEVAAAPEKIRLSFASASTGTWIYMFCAILSEIWRKNIPGLDITVLATPGSTANYIPMDKGELVGIRVPDDLVWKKEIT